MGEAEDDFDDWVLWLDLWARAPRDPAVQSWLDGLFFGGPAESGAPQNISLVQAGSWQAACAYAARQIRSGAASGLRYRDFTVCMTDEAACALPMQTLLSRAGIPVYSAANAPLLKKPLVAALLSALQAILRYEQGPMLSFLKSGFSPVSEDECDWLERYVHYWNIRGQLWEKPWQMHPRGLGLPMTPEDTQALEALDRIREQAVAPLRRLRLAFAKAPDTDARLRAIASFWEELDVAGWRVLRRIPAGEGARRWPGRRPGSGRPGACPGWPRNRRNRCSRSPRHRRRCR